MQRPGSLVALALGLGLGLGLGAAGCGSTPAAIADLDAALPPADAVDAPVDAAPCGLRTGQRGKTYRTVQAAGLARTYHVYLPEAADPRTPMPLIYVHHGYTMSGQAMFDLTEYAALADAEGIALAFPDGQGGPNSSGAPWNVGADVCASTVGAPPVAPGDDFALLDAIADDVAEDQCLDRAHTYVTGFSMGGYFANHAGCMRDDVRAIAPHSGGTHDLTGCAVTRKPVIVMHGSADTLVPASCGISAAAAWAARNGCATTTTSRSVQGGTCVRYDGCPAGGQVERCTFTAMGHCWAGGPLSSGVYACPLYASATALAWEFFKNDAWN